MLIIQKMLHLMRSNNHTALLHMPDKLFHSLKKYASSITSLYLFTMQNGELMTSSSFRRFWDNILDKLNIAAGGEKYTRTDLQKDKEQKPIRLIANDITPHMFRHTYATNLYYAGIDIKTAQMLLGHSSIQMTMDVYTHLDNTKVLSAGDKLNAFFDSQNNSSDSQNIVKSEKSQ